MESVDLNDFGRNKFSRTLDHRSSYFFYKSQRLLETILKMDKVERQIDQRTKNKLITMHRAQHPRDDIERQ